MAGLVPAIHDFFKVSGSSEVVGTRRIFIIFFGAGMTGKGCILSAVMAGQKII
jgi:hypothetical protein